MSKDNRVKIGMLGMVIGGFIGYVTRPSALLVGKVPFIHVITWGTLLDGFDQILVPLARQSFYMLYGYAFVGSLIAFFGAPYIERFLKRGSVAENPPAE